MIRPVLLTGFLFLFFSSYSQEFSINTWRYIDTSIERKKNLLEVSTLVQQLKQKAISEKEYFQMARCYYYQMLITDQRTEDSLYFRNSAFIDSILKIQGSHAELKLAMHLLQAKRLSAFTTRNNRFSRQRYERKDIPVNYAAYTNDELDSIAQVHFKEAKSIAKIFL